MDKKGITILSATFAVVAIGFSVYFYSNTLEVKREKMYAEQRAFSEVISSMSQIDTAINKSIYATTPGYQAVVFSEIYAAAENAKANLSQIKDVDDLEAQEIISRIGDYSFSLIKKVANSEQLTNDDVANLKMLATQNAELTQNLSEMKVLYDNGEMSKYVREITTNDDNKVINVSSFSSKQEPENQQFATLLYDGPFSSHIDKMQPELLKNEKELTKEQAKEEARKFLQTNIENVVFVEKVDGKIPVYKFRSEKEDDNIYLDVTIKGGHIINFKNYRAVKEATISTEQAVKIAEEFIRRAGTFKTTYYIEENGVVTVNFAAIQDGVIMYPDLIKLSIYKDDGTLAGVEARGYIMSHTKRVIGASKNSISSAKAVLSSDLQVLTENMAIIHTSGKNEVLTYEFKCKNSDNKNYIVYVNADTLQIENMFILIEQDNGTLAM